MRFTALILLLIAPGLLASGQADFVRNQGQWPEAVTFKATLPDGQLWMEDQSLTYQFFDPAILEWMHPVGPLPEGDPVYREHSYRIHFEGSAPPIAEGKNEKPFYHNYYLGDDPSRWVHGAPVFGECIYRGLYPHTDLKVYSRRSSLKYDFVLRPGADPSLIRMRFEGGVQLSLENGELVIQTSVNEVREKAPYAYQVINGRVHDVPCSFVLDGNEIHFELGRYRKDVELVIDPEIAFSTYIGSSASNFGFTACDDSDENLISGAAVFASNYPVTVGAFEDNFNTSAGNYMDIAISKFSPDGGSLLYSTYLGGGQQETPHSIVADNDDNFILMGVTGSSDFPTSGGAYQQTFVGGPILVMSEFFTSGHPDGCDLFVTKFSPAGALLNSTFVGGDANDGLNYGAQLFYNYGDAFRGEINIDDNNNVYVASVTRGDFPTTANAMQDIYGGGECDGIVFRLDPSLSTLQWSTFVGGASGDACYSIEFAPDGMILVAGGTRSSNFAFVGGGEDTSFGGQTDGFILRINPGTYNLISGTFVGTADYDQVYFLQTDDSGNIYALGQTAGTMDVTPGIYGQPNSGQFIRKYSNNLSTLLWSTTIGTGSGEIDISPTAFLVSDCGQIYFSGWGGDTNSNTCGIVYDCLATNSTTNGLPVTDNAFQPTTDGSDFYLCVLSPDASQLIYASFLGGTESAEHVDGGTSRFDKNGSVYQAVCAGCQGNSDFPTTAGAWSATNPSFGCNIAVFRFDLGQVNADLEIEGPSEICEGTIASFSNLSVGASTFEWSFGDGETSAAFEPDHIYESNGTFTVTLVATDELECLTPDTATITITVLPGVNPSVDPVDPICEGQSIQLVATGSANLFWLPDATLSATDIPDPIATPTVTTTYYVVDMNDCESDTVSVTVELYVPETSISEDATICIGGEVQLLASGGVTYQWSPSDGLSAVSVANPIASPLATTTYSVTITTAEGCEVIRTVTVSVEEDPPGGVVYPDVSMCAGNSAQLLAEDATTWNWSPAATLSNAFIQDPIASPSDTTTYTVTMTNACGSGTAQVTVNVIFPGVQVFGGGTICKGQYIEAWAEGASEYFWNPPAFAFPPNAQYTLLSPPETMAFTVSGVDENGCGAQDSVWVFVLPLPEVDAGPDQYFDFPGSVHLFGNSFGLDYSWSPPDHLSCTDCPYPIADPDTEMVYYLSVIDHNGCVATDSVLVKPYFPIWVPNTITPNNDGINDYFRAYGHQIEGFTMVIFDRWGNKVFESDDIEKVWDGGIDGYYVQNDAYIWVIEYDTLERREQLVGHVNVIR